MTPSVVTKTEDWSTVFTMWPLSFLLQTPLQLPRMPGLYTHRLWCGKYKHRT